MNQRRFPVGLLVHPVTWLLLLGAAVWAHARAQGWLVPERTPDTQSYEWSNGIMSFSDALQNLRSFGYPLVLEVHGLFADDYSLLPTLHLLTYFTAVVLFWLGVRSYSGSGWLAFSAAAPLMVPCVLPWVRQIQPELMAPAFAVFTVAFLFLLVCRPRSASLWIALALATMFTYQLRPAYAFMAVLVPIVGISLWVGTRPRGLHHVRSFALGLAAVSLLPLIGYCSLRWAVVGHFGLVNFEGYPLLGIAACLLDEETVAAMPDEHRRLGGRILRQRRLRNWPRYTAASDTQAFFPQHGQNIWFIGEPLARMILMRERSYIRRRWGEEILPLTPLEAWQIENAHFPPLAGELARAINDRMASFSKWLIGRQPMLYVKWVSDAFLYGLGRIGACSVVTWLVLALAASMPFLYLSRRYRSSPRTARPPWRRSEAAFCVYGLFLLGVGFLVGKLAQMVVVIWPWDRYLFAALLFLPSALGAALFEVWRGVRDRRT